MSTEPSVKLSDYNFARNAFPIVLNSLPEYRYCIGPKVWVGSGCKLLDVTGFRIENIVNRNHFDWSLPMSEAAASAFIKSRAGLSGNVDRNIPIRINYSVVKVKGSSEPILYPFIYSVDAFSDERRVTKIASVPKVNTQGPDSAKEWIAKVAEAQIVTNEIGTYEAAYMRGRSNPWGTITLTDVGIDYSDQNNGGPLRLAKSFYSFFDNLSGDTDRTFRRVSQNGWGLDIPQTFFDNCGNCDLRFKTEAERDRFFFDVTKAISDWSAKYKDFAISKIYVDQRCEVKGNYIQPC